MLSDRLFHDQAIVIALANILHVVHDVLYQVNAEPADFAFVDVQFDIRILVPERVESDSVIDHLQAQSALRNVMRTRSEEHTSELQSLMRNSYAVFCLKKKTQRKQ